MIFKNILNIANFLIRPMYKTQEELNLYSLFSYKMI